MVQANRQRELDLGLAYMNQDNLTRRRNSYNTRNNSVSNTRNIEVAAINRKENLQIGQGQRTRISSNQKSYQQMGQRSYYPKRQEETIVRNRRSVRETKRRKRIIRRRIILIAAELIFILLAIFLILHMLNKGETFTEIESPDVIQQDTEKEAILPQKEEKVQGISKEAYNKHPQWEENFLTPNEYSRPGDPLKEVTSIFVHYTANQNTSAAQNRSYFEQLKDTKERSASAHFIIGYDGEIIQCIPLDEIAYAVMTRNEDSISIECCYKSDNGQFTQETYDSLISLLAWLKETYNLETDDILRHYDCGGKKCPIYYTEHEDAWEKLKQDVAAYTL